MNTASRRTHKVASLVRSELARLLIEEVSDPRLKDIVITEVVLTKDLRQARILFAKGDTNLKEVERGLKRGVAFFRRKIGENLGLRYVPELEFVVDDHGDALNRILQVFDEVAAQRAGNEPT